MIDQLVEFPEWIDFFPEERLVHARITEVKVSQILFFRFNSFDLKADQIEMEMVMSD